MADVIEHVEGGEHVLADEQLDELQKLIDAGKDDEARAFVRDQEQKHLEADE